jgi:hypothetical protein
LIFSVKTREDKKINTGVRAQKKCNLKTKIIPAKKKERKRIPPYYYLAPFFPSFDFFKRHLM